MKNFFTILNLIFFVLITNVEAGIISDTKLNKGNFYQGKIIWRSIELNLPEGKWEYMDNDDWWPIHVNLLLLQKIIYLNL